ncbi:unnamed protein product [Pylaiella littoralis]
MGFLLLWLNWFESYGRKTELVYSSAGAKYPAAAAAAAAGCLVFFFPFFFHVIDVCKLFFVSLSVTLGFKQSSEEHDHTHSSRGMALLLVLLHSFESDQQINQDFPRAKRYGNVLRAEAEMFLGLPEDGTGKRSRLCIAVWERDGKAGRR